MVDDLPELAASEESTEGRCAFPAVDTSMKMSGVTGAQLDAARKVIDSELERATARHRLTAS